MQVSEQASEKVELADHRPGASTYTGSTWRGGWRPILLKLNDFSRPIIIDWLCPRCNRLLTQNQTCPGCGLRLLDSPRSKEPLPKSRKIYQYHNWLAGLENETGRASRIDDQHKASPIRGSTFSTKRNSHRVRHKISKHRRNNDE